MTQDSELMEFDLEVVFRCDVKGNENKQRLKHEVVMMEMRLLFNCGVC